MADTLLPSPCFIVDQGKLIHNLEILDSVQERTGAKIVLALKGFALFALFPTIKKYLKGTTASGLHEALLGREEFGGEVHVYSPAYSEQEFIELLGISNHISFNSFTQKERLLQLVAGHPREKEISFGMRINPEHAEVETEIYNPCARFSRLGVTKSQCSGQSFDGITGLHFHTLCEQGADVLFRTWEKVKEKFHDQLLSMKWINFGGGHHITKPNYDLDLLCEVIRDAQNTYGLEVILEPGEAIAIHTGVLRTTVMDIIENEKRIAILDTSATAHMPDVLEMPYRPEVLGAGEPEEYPYTYRLGGLTCLAGDVIGDYSFPAELKVGDAVVFDDMSHYTMVKTTTFNGIPLPSIAVTDLSGTTKVVRQFGYEDYKMRLS